MFSVPTSMAPALLFVYSEPGSAVSPDEFNDWYDNEHVPLCICIPSFRSWSRWVATDDKQPSYLALYDIDSPAAVDDVPLSALTERDKSITSRLALVERRTYTLHKPVHPPAAGAAYSTGAPGPFITSVAMDIPAEHVTDFDQWYDEEHVHLISKTPGWVRTRRFVFAEVLVLGAAEEGRSLRPAGGPHRFLTLHEWECPEALATEEYKAAITTPSALRFKGLATRFELRMFKLHKVWDRD